MGEITFGDLERMSVDLFLDSKIDSAELRDFRRVLEKIAKMKGFRKLEKESKKGKPVQKIVVLK